jgi:hypothetical protein
MKLQHKKKKKKKKKKKTKNTKSDKGTKLMEPICFIVLSQLLPV